MKKFFISIILLASLVHAASWQKIATTSSVSSSIVDIFKDGSGIALYKLDGNANDAGGVYNGTPSNITYTTGKIGQAAVFNGGAKITNTANVPQTKTFTISAWINHSSSSFATTRPMIFSLNNQYLEIYFAIAKPGDFFPAGTLLAEIWTPTPSGGVKTSNQPITWNAWHNVIAVVSNSSVIALYVDGISQPIVPDNQGSATINRGILLIGCRTDDSSYNFNGSIDQVRIFNRALTQAEVTQLYNEGAQ